MNPTALHLLALAKVEEVGYWAVRGLYERYAGLSGLWTSSVRGLAGCLRRAKVKRPTTVARSLVDNQSSLLAAATREYESLRSRGVTLLCQGDEAFPNSLLSIPYPPYWLFVQGDLSLLSGTGVACVGTRRPSKTGVEMAKWTASALASDGAAVVSGLAQGIDAAAHVEALERRGRTLAVLGHGIDVNMCASAAKLRDRILAEQGAIVTEYLPAENFNSRSFVWRNRLQSGLSVCTVPVEWTLDSGTAHTVEFALKQRRRVVGLAHETWAVAEHPELKALRKRHATILELPRDRDRIGEVCARAPWSGDPDLIGKTRRGRQLALFQKRKA